LNIICGRQDECVNDIHNFFFRDIVDEVSIEVSVGEEP